MRFLLFVLSIATLFAGNDGIFQAQGYQQNSQLQYEWDLALIHRYPWRGDERVLDIGCGDGKVTAYIANQCLGKGGSIFGTDVSASMIEYANRLFPEQGNVKFQQKNVLDLDFKEEFDVAVSFCTLHWVADQKTALQNVFRALKRGGKALFLNVGKSTVNLGPNTFALATSNKWAHLFPDLSPTKFHFSLEAYKNLLEECGFNLIWIEEEVSNYTFADRKAFVSFLSPLITERKSLPMDLQDEFLEELADQILEKSEVLNVPFVKLLVLAEKK